MKKRTLISGCGLMIGLFLTAHPAAAHPALGRLQAVWNQAESQVEAVPFGDVIPGGVNEANIETAQGPLELVGPLPETAMAVQHQRGRGIGDGEFSGRQRMQWMQRMQEMRQHRMRDAVLTPRERAILRMVHRQAKRGMQHMQRDHRRGMRGGMFEGRGIGQGRGQGARRGARGGQAAALQKMIEREVGKQLRAILQRQQQRSGPGMQGFSDDGSERPRRGLREGREPGEMRGMQRGQDGRNDRPRGMNQRQERGADRGTNRGAQILERFDADGDGLLNADELMTLLGRLEARTRQGAQQGARQGGRPGSPPDRSRGGSRESREG